MTRRRLRIVALLTAVAAVGVLLWLRSEPSKAPFLDYVADLRARGEPVTVAELIGPAPDRSDNAVDVVMASIDVERAVYAAGVTGPWDDKATQPWYETASSERIEALRDQLDRNRPYFDALDAASRRGHLWRRLGCGDRILALDDQLVRGLQAVYRLSSARAFVSSDHEDRTVALESQLRISELARGSAIRFMVATAIRKGVTFSLRHELGAECAAAAAARPRLDPLLARPWLPTFREFARAERASTVELLAGVLDGSIQPPADDAFLGKTSISWGVRRALGIWGNGGTPVGSAEDYVKACRFIETMAALETKSHAALQRDVDGRTVALGTYSTASVVAIMYPKLVRAITQTDAATRLARIALAAAEHRAKHGDFPASLDELKPMFPDGLPLDPYTDAPFAYARTATGARIASLGRLAEETPLDDATLRERVLVWELTR